MAPHLQRVSDVSAVPMSEVLARVADELRALAWTSDKLQDAISPVVLASGSSDKSSFATLQALDLMSQSIAGIAQVIDALTQADASQGMIDPAEACRSLTLSDLAARITGTAETSAPSSESDALFFEDFGHRRSAG